MIETDFVFSLDEIKKTVFPGISNDIKFFILLYYSCHDQKLYDTVCSSLLKNENYDKISLARNYFLQVGEIDLADLLYQKCKDKLDEISLIIKHDFASESLDEIFCLQDVLELLHNKGVLKDCNESEENIQIFNEMAEKFNKYGFYQLFGFFLDKISHPQLKCLSSSYDCLINCDLLSSGNRSFKYLRTSLQKLYVTEDFESVECYEKIVSCINTLFCLFGKNEYTYPELVIEYFFYDKSSKEALIKYCPHLVPCLFYYAICASVPLFKLVKFAQMYYEKYPIYKEAKSFFMILILNLFCSMDVNSIDEILKNAINEIKDSYFFNYYWINSFYININLYLIEIKCCIYKQNVKLEIDDFDENVIESLYLNISETEYFAEFFRELLQKIDFFPNIILNIDENDNYMVVRKTEHKISKNILMNELKKINFNLRKNIRFD